MKDTFKQFFRFSKIDEEKQLVYGVVSGPEIDSQRELVPPDILSAAMPAYMERGNLREMHQLIAAGKVIDYQENADGETEIAAKVVDPISWLKVKEGVLTGFSIAGDGIFKTQMINGEQVKVCQKLRLDEISLVDRPAYPKANITLWKAARPTKRGNEMEQEEIQEQLESAGAGLLKLAKASSAGKKAKPAVKVAAKAKVTAKAKTRKADDSSDDTATTDETEGTPDLTPEQIMQGMLALHNAMVMAGNMDGAAGITDSIACFQASLNDQSADDAGDEDMDGDTDLELDDDSGLTMADGDSDTTDNNDDITSDQEDDANSGPDFSTKADEGAPSDGDRQDVDSPPDNSDDTDKAKKSKTLRTSKALTFRGGAGSYRGLMSKVASYDPQREMAVTKAMTANFTKVAQVLEGFSARLDNLEAQPRQGGPVVRAVEKSLVSGGGSNGNGGQISEVQALQKALDTTSDPFLKTRLREEIAVAETRTMYRFTTS